MQPTENAERLKNYFEQAATNLSKAKSTLFNASEKVILATRAKGEAENHAFNTGVLANCKNDPERKAVMKNHLKDWQDQLDAVEEHERFCRAELDQFQLSWDLCRYQLRILEVMAAK